MKRTTKAAISALAAAAGTTAFGAGFGLYEMSAAAMINGGNWMGRAPDASAVYYNPATQSGLTGTWVTAGLTLLHPPLDTRVNGVGTGKMNPGWFYDPHFFVTHQLTDDLNLGLGGYADFGLGSKYHNNWPLAWNSIQTDIATYTASPTLSWRITDRWSLAGGVRFSHMTFEQKRILRFSELLAGAHPFAGMMGDTHIHYTARNDVDVGYLLGTAYEVTDDFSVGAVWRSRERLRMKGHCSASDHGTVPAGAGAAAYDGSFNEKVDLPMSAAVGFNWDNALWVKDLHLGWSCTWTEWSTIDTIQFGAGGMDLGWHNAYRTGFGFTYDFTEKFTGGVGYVYDWDPTRERRPQTMLPAGDRHNIYYGLTWHISPHWDFTIAGAMVLMESKTAWYDNPATGAPDQYKFQTRNSHTYLASATITCHF